MIATMDFHHRRSTAAGANFLRHFRLMVNMQQCQLIDTLTHLHMYIQGIFSTTSSLNTSICPKNSTDPYLSLLSSTHMGLLTRLTYRARCPSPHQDYCSPQTSGTRALSCSQTRVRAHALTWHHPSFIQCLVLPLAYGAQEDFW